MKTLAKRLASSMIAFAATLALAVAMSSPASAATTYTPGGGPNVNFVGSNLSFKFIQANQTFTCQKFNPAGAVVNPGLSRAIVANAANLGSYTIAGCTNPWIGTFAVVPAGTHGLRVKGDPVGSVWPVQFTSMAFTMTAAGCTFNVSGTANGSFDVATQKFTPSSGASGLKVSSTPTGYICPILGIANGQDLELGGTWTNTPPAGSGPLTITVP